MLCAELIVSPILSARLPMKLRRRALPVDSLWQRARGAYYHAGHFIGGKITRSMRGMLRINGHRGAHASVASLLPPAIKIIDDAQSGDAIINH